MISDIVQVNWESQKKVLFSNLSLLRKKEIHTDVTLSCEGQYFAAHRLILTMGCGYFAKNCENASNPSFSLILICGIRASILEALLNFIYDGTTTLKREDINDLSKAGAMLEVPGLMDLGKEMVLLNNSMKSPSSAALAPEMSPRKISSSSKNINNNKGNIVPTQPVIKEDNDGNQVENRAEENGKSESMEEENKSEEIRTSGRCIELLFDSDSSDSENFEGWDQTTIDESKPKFCLKQGSTKRKRRNHRCHKCSRSFYSSSSLKKHIKCHVVKTKKDPFSCFFCGMGFRNEKSCKEHVFIHLNEKENVKDFSNIEGKGNVSQVAKNSQIMEKCEVRLSKNSTKMKLEPESESLSLDCDPVVKKQKKNDDSSDECTIDDVLKSVSESFQYLSENSDFVINDDSIYDEGITDDDGLESTNSSNTNDLEGSSSIHKLKETLNLKDSVTSVNTRVCRYCNTEFLSSKSFRKHRITECKITECPYCLADFETKNGYENHISVHDGTDKPYVCPQCSFCTDSKLNFENHMSVHTGIFRFWCLLCDFQAKRINELMSHTVSDHPEVNIIALYDLLTK